MISRPPVSRLKCGRNRGPSGPVRRRLGEGAPVRRRLGEGGFTLLELLLATAIGAVVLLVVNATFFSALRLHNATHDRIDGDLVIQRTLGIVRRDLAGIMIPPNPQATTPKLSGQLVTDGATTNAMDATAERITPDIYTNSGRLDGWSTFSDVQMVSYYLAPATDGSPTKNLVRVVTRNLLPVIEATTEDQTLLTGVTAAAMSYFDGENWLDIWDSTASSSLPTAIKFSVVVAPRDRTVSSAEPAPIELIVPVIVKTIATLQQEVAAEAASL
ncbi:type II secretion system protein GspJ [Horticoccus sp. 23ND18S-11]|uniref:type II secretion system protein GspJ n=1 Tax=Horticoccus sp. 23ND18S-11 TaxID=3391832 RepID=UPI0039C9B25C